MCEEHSGDSHQTSHKEIPQGIGDEKLMDEDVDVPPEDVSQ